MILSQFRVALKEKPGQMRQPTPQPEWSRSWSASERANNTARTRCCRAQSLCSSATQNRVNSRNRQAAQGGKSVAGEREAGGGRAATGRIWWGNWDVEKSGKRYHTACEAPQHTIMTEKLDSDLPLPYHCAPDLHLHGRTAFHLSSRCHHDHAHPED